jgi:CRP-like cAMP-binding protein
MALQLEDDSLANKILLALPRATLQRISPHLELVSLQQGQVIYHPEARIQKIYFINRGLVSLVRSMRDGRSMEIGAIGIEGVAGLGALFGIPEATLESVVQLPGAALCGNPDVIRQAGRGRLFEKPSSAVLPPGREPDRADGRLQSLAHPARAVLPLAAHRP